MARKGTHSPIKEGNITNPFEVHPPSINKTQAIYNPKVWIVIYKDEVLIDSAGASDNMTYMFAHLTLIRTAFL
jgi:hypothetical protein